MSKKNLIITVSAATIVIIALFTWWNFYLPKNSASNSDLAKQKVVIYKSPACGCCTAYGSYLTKNDFEVEIKNVNDMDAIKEKYQIPHSQHSCHTTLVGNYFVEGHVPIEAVEKLLKEKPSIKGIALPGMPVGSPGMSGTKRGVFAISQLSDEGWLEFMEI